MSNRIKIPTSLLASFKTTEEKEQFKRQYQGVTHVTDIIKAVLEDKLEQTVNVKASSYLNPSWAYSQADRNGYARALREVISLLPTTGE